MEKFNCLFVSLPTNQISDVSSTKEIEIDGNAADSLSPNHSLNGRGNGPDIFETKSCNILSQDYIYILCMYIYFERNVIL